MSWNASSIAGISAEAAGSNHTTNADEQTATALAGTFDCSGTPKASPVSSYVAERDTDAASDAIAALSGVAKDYVALVYDAQGGPEGGWTDCTHQTTAEVTDWSVTMGAFGDLELRAADGSSQPTLPTTDLLSHVHGYLLRPTALYWSGQDPANDANRILWLPGEVDTLHDAFTMTDLSGYDIQVSVTAFTYTALSKLMCLL